MFSIFILLFAFEIVHGIENDTCLCHAKIETLEQKDQALENRISNLENLLGVVKLESGDSGDTEYVLVTAGERHRQNSVKFSVIDMKSPSFSCEVKIDMEDYEVDLGNGAGGVLNNDTVVFCGRPPTPFSKTPKCIRLANDSMIWEKNFVYRPGPRDSYIFGGYFSYDDRLFITSIVRKEGNFQVVTTEGESTGPKLPKPTWGHCTIKINEHMIMITGGNIRNGHNPDPITETFFYCFHSETWTEGPKLNMKRATHGCASFKGPNDQQVLAVFGGDNLDGPDTELTDSVEFLDLSQETKSWTYGPPLPTKIFSFATLSAKDQRSVYVMGGLCEDCRQDDRRDQILKLTCENTLDTCDWNVMDQKMKYPTNGHIALHIPDFIAQKFCTV